MIIKNGIIATASDVVKADISIENGKIKEISANIQANKEQIIDAAGMYVIPGGVDVHTHFSLDTGSAVTVDDFYTGTLSAAFGGTTTIVDHIGFGPSGCRLRHQIDKYHGLAKDNACIDYSFHGVIQHVNNDVLNDMQELLTEGISSYKLYLTYGFKLSDAEVFQVLKKAAEVGIVITVHAENDAIISSLKEDFAAKGLLSPKYHALSRPEVSESESVNRMASLAKAAGDAPLYIVHLSTWHALSFIKKAKDEGQKNLFVETCPQYLFLDDSRYELPGNEGLKYIMSPPLRDKKNNELLWRAISEKDINVVATDHCPFNFATDKIKGKDDFRLCPNGAPGVELRIPLMFSEGVGKNKISINRFVDICCTEPAKIFGLYPKKGTIMPGSDADLVIIDPDKEVEITKNIMHDNVDYTPYEKMKVRGYPKVVISRGEVIVENSIFTGNKGRGKFINRKKTDLLSL